MEMHSVDSTESNKSLEHELGLICDPCLHGCAVPSLSVRGGGFKIHFLQKYFTNSVDSTEFICRKNAIVLVTLQHIVCKSGTLTTPPP